MRITLLGHAAVLIEAADGTRLLIDPYESGGFGGKMGYRPITQHTDFVVCTHDHADHCALHTLRDDPVLLTGARAQGGPFVVTRHALEHDEYGGRRFGGQVDALRVEVDQMVCVHLSDVGHSPGVQDIEALWGADVACVPVGGFYTIGAAQAREWCERLGARLVVPMHHDSADCGLELEPLEYFTTQMRHLYVSWDVDDPMICVDDCKTQVVELPMICGQAWLTRVTGGVDELARVETTTGEMGKAQLECTPRDFLCIQVMRSDVSQEQRPSGQVFELKGGNSDGERL